jgi:hypothetical protein
MDTRAWTSKSLLMFWLCLLLAGMSPFHPSALASSDERDFEAIDGYMTAKMRAAYLGPRRHPRTCRGCGHSCATSGSTDRPRVLLCSWSVWARC